jgi:hypothetical protein
VHARARRAGLPRPRLRRATAGRAGLDTSSPQFQAANNACRSLLSPGGSSISNLTEAQQAEMLAGALKFARCMRDHGISKFPDPTPDGWVPLDGSDFTRYQIDPNSPQFRRAMQACRSDLPAKPGGRP